MKLDQKGKGNWWRLQATFPDVGQKQVALLTQNERDAITRANRFMATAEANGFATAKRELTGKDVIKRGDPLTYERTCALFREFLEDEDNPPRESTVKAYLYNLQRCMDACGAKTIQQINQKVIRQKLRAHRPTPQQSRSFASIIRNAKSVFKKRALAYYRTRGFEILNPFEGMEVKGPKVEPYTRLDEEIRAAVWNAAMAGEMVLQPAFRTVAGKRKLTLKPSEPERLGAQAAMIVLLGMGAGLRRSEIEACRSHWFTIQADNVVLSVREENAAKGGAPFQTKNYSKRDVSITRELYDTLLELRAKAVEECSDIDETRKLVAADPHFVPVLRRKGEGARLWGRFKQVNNWLKQMGVPSTKKIHDLRKELGSAVVEATGNIYEAAKVLGNSALVAETHYVGVGRTKTVDMGAAINKKESEADVLKKENEELRKLLAAVAAKLA